MTGPAILPGPVGLDARATAGRVGLVVLATDHTTEPDFARLVAPRGVGVYATRIPFANPVTPATLAAMAPDISAAAALILPDEPLDAVVYSCTSASAAIGDDAVRAAIAAGKPGARAITPISAGFAALRALGARRIALLAPYDAATTAMLADCFRAGGFDLASVAGMGIADDRDMARIDAATLGRAARAATPAGADALFVACTAVRAAGCVAQLETATGVPVVTANLATAWAALRACGDHSAAGPGRLMALPEPAGHPFLTEDSHA